MNKIQELGQLGQSVWLDYIRRSFVTSGEMQALIDQGVRGVTSNPAIFEKAIAQSNDYDDQLQELVVGGASVSEAYEAMALRDIHMATGLFLPVYEESEGEDGYVSLEVNPNLAFDTDGTVAEARRYFEELQRPNLMIKVPATREGIPAVEQLIAEGINVNITLMFSMAHYEAVANAYIRGLERLAASGGDLSKVGSVASFFVSRVDVKLDGPLAEAGAPEMQAKIAIDNSKLVYQRFRELFSGERWQRLAQQGARVQRPLWASTSTKDPALPDTLYVDTLIGPDTVNTLPPETLEAFLDHGTVALTVGEDLEGSRARIERLAELGIDLHLAGEELQSEGVDKFIAPFEDLLGTIAARRDQIRAETQHMSSQLRRHQSLVDATLADMAAQDVVKRIWRRDHTVWRPEPDEIADRLGWLDCAQTMLDSHESDAPATGGQTIAWGSPGNVQSLADAMRDEGYTDVLLLGMGGSSLAPELFGKLWGPDAGGLRLTVLDSTSPDVIRATTDGLDPARTLYLVSTKSGGTIETRTLFQHCYAQANLALCGTEVGDHFVAITDPGSSLVDLAREHKFRAIYLNDPNIGGRYSALSYFGLVPAALAGVDLPLLLQRALAMASGCQLEPGQNPGAWLGAVLGSLACAGRNKLTLVCSPGLESFGDWVEQLVAESTGKNGMGILPVTGETLSPPERYGADRLFVQLKLEGDDSHDAALGALEESGHPVLRLTLIDFYDVGAQFFLWEYAVAVAGWCMGIQPFDQPDVEGAKVQARQMVAAWQASGALPQLEAAISDAGVRVYGETGADSLAGALASFLGQAGPGDYIGLQIWFAPDDNSQAALASLREQLRAATGLATTFGYGPRFLHSTGQLHKGDSGAGLFIQLVADAGKSLSIPGEGGLAFDVLFEAQALGDREALLAQGRRVLRLHLGDQPVEGLRTIAGAIQTLR
ncbi:MAG: bifunctional transaldolase/phosoglucose isomerase [Anaerolineaceae bacterium]|nr:bifunctional transaldolase/phosoglucose isomerase [Anaerolineaceae bacterium]